MSAPTLPAPALPAPATVRDAAAYRRQLQALLPPGAAWSRDPDGRLAALLGAWAAEFARLDARAARLAREAVPTTTLELLADWEAAAGLPDPCVPPPQTQSARRDALVARLRTRGGQRAGYYEAVAAGLGYAVTVTDFRPFQAGRSAAGEALTNGDWRFAWRIAAPEDTVRPFQAGLGAAGEPLAAWGNEQLECALRPLGPAHAIPLFTYG